MGLSTVLFFGFIYYHSGVQALSVETQNGLTVRVAMAPHVYLNNQTDQFRFEVKSCEEVNVTLESKGASNEYGKLFLRPDSNVSVFYACYSTSHGQIQCSSLVSGIRTPDFCSESVVFWVMKPGVAIYKIGSGCTVGVDKIARLITPMMAFGVVKMEFESKSTAVWKLGDSVCVPPTTTRSQTTTSTQSSGTTDESVTTDMTSPDTDVTSPDTKVENNSQKCPAATKSDDKSSSSVTHSATWLLMTPLILCQLL